MVSSSVQVWVDAEKPAGGHVTWRWMGVNLLVVMWLGSGGVWIFWWSCEWALRILFIWVWCRGNWRTKHSMSSANSARLWRIKVRLEWYWIMCSLLLLFVVYRIPVHTSHAMYRRHLHEGASWKVTTVRIIFFAQVKTDNDEALEVRTYLFSSSFPNP